MLPGLLEDEDFVPALKSIRDDLDNWANWTQPRIEPTRDMTSLRIRVEYHYARLYANGIALDSMVAEVHLRFSESRDTKSYKEKSIVLGLLSGNRRCPKQRSHRLCGYSMSNESKTGIHWAWWRISGINGTSSQGLCHMKTLRLIMRYKSVSAG